MNQVHQLITGLERMHQENTHEWTSIQQEKKLIAYAQKKTLFQAWIMAQERIYEKRNVQLEEAINALQRLQSIS